MSTTKEYPTEIIQLPSEGVFYPETSPLRSGTIELKYMTAKEEDILTSVNLNRSGLVWERLLQSLIVDRSISMDDLLLGDINAITVASRILAYGKDYPIAFDCDACGRRSTYTADLSGLKMSPPSPNHVNGEYSVTLPSGATVTIRPLTWGDERAIRDELEAHKKTGVEVLPSVTTRLKHVIKSVNGSRDGRVIRQFVDNMIIRDTKELRAFMNASIPDVDFTVKGKCSHCKHEADRRLLVGADFFWPGA